MSSSTEDDPDEEELFKLDTLGSFFRVEDKLRAVVGLAAFGTVPGGLDIIGTGFVLDSDELDVEFNFVAGMAFFSGVLCLDDSPKNG